MSDGKVYSTRTVVRSDAPNEEKKYYYDRARREFGYKLIGILQENRLPAVIDYDEIVGKWEDSDVITFRITLTSVKYKDVVLPRVSYETYNNEKPSRWYRFVQFIRGE